jgi:hypothetical protein
LIAAKIPQLILAISPLPSIGLGDITQTTYSPSLVLLAIPSFKVAEVLRHEVLCMSHYQSLHFEKYFEKEH